MLPVAPSERGEALAPGGSASIAEITAEPPPLMLLLEEAVRSRRCEAAGVVRTMPVTMTSDAEIGPPLLPGDAATAEFQAVAAVDAKACWKAADWNTAAEEEEEAAEESCSIAENGSMTSRRGGGEGGDGSGGEGGDSGGDGSEGEARSGGGEGSEGTASGGEETTRGEGLTSGGWEEIIVGGGEEGTAGGEGRGG